MRCVVLVLMALGLFVWEPLYFGATSSAHGENSFKDACIKYFEERKYDLAIDACSKAIVIDPNDANAYSARGLAYLAKGEHHLAIKDLTKAIKINPNYVAAYAGRGKAYLFKDKYDLAIKDFTKVIDIYPDAVAYAGRGFAYLLKGEYDPAIKDFSKAIELDPNYIDAYYGRGKTYFDKGEHDLAVKDFTKVIEINPNDIEAYTSRGLAFLYKDQYDLAIKDFTKAIKINPNDASTYVTRGNIYRYKGQYDLAIKDFTKAIELDPNYIDAYDSRGMLYFFRDEYDLAIRDFTKAIEIWGAYHNREKTYLTKGEYNSKLDEIVKTIDIASTYIHRGMAYFAKGEYDLTIKDFTKAFEITPSPLLQKILYAYDFKGLAYAARGDWKRAKLDLEKAVKITPKNPLAHYHLAFVLYKLGFKERAVKELKKAYELNPQIMEARGKDLTRPMAKSTLHFYAEEYLFAAEHLEAPKEYLAKAGKIFASKPPYLEIASVELFDENGDRLFSAGETGKVVVKITNSGKGPAYRISLKIASPFFKKELVIPKLAPGKTLTKSVSFKVPVRVKTQNVYADISLEAGKFSPEPVRVTFTTKAPIPPHFKITYRIDDDRVGESMGDGDGNVEPRETIELLVTVANTGKGPAKDVRVLLFSEDVDIIKKEARIGNLPPGASNTGKLVFFVPANVSKKEINFTISIKEALGIFGASTKLAFNIKKGGGKLYDYTVTTK